MVKELLELLESLNRDIQEDRITAGNSDFYICQFELAIEEATAANLPSLLKLLEQFIALLPSFPLEDETKANALTLLADFIHILEPCKVISPENDQQLQTISSQMATLVSTAQVIVPAAAPATTTATPVPDLAPADDFDPEYYTEYEELLPEFIAEANELLDSMESDLLQFCNADDDIRHRMFRAMHTLKGGSGMMQLHQTKELSHSMETLLQKVRDDIITPTQDMETVLLKSVDLIRIIVGRLESQENPLLPTQHLSTIIEAYANGETPQPTAPTVPDKTSVAVPQPAFDQAYYSEYEKSLPGFIAEVEDIAKSIEQDLLQFCNTDDETYQRMFRTMHTLKGCAGMMQMKPVKNLAHAMENILQQVKDGVLKPSQEIESSLLACIDVIRNTTAQLQSRGNPLIPTEQLCTQLAALLIDESSAPAHPQAKPVQVAPQAANAIPVAGKTAAPKKEVVKTSFLRVDTRKLDSVMEQIGEMLVERIRLEQCQKDIHGLMLGLQKIKGTRGREVDYKQLCGDFSNSLDAFILDFNRTVETITRSTSDLQESVMQMRLVPLEQIFCRFPRLVRDLSIKLDKKIELEVIGEDTAIDKSVCEILAEPLIHLFRNSIDHGIETPEQRIAAGKPACGKILLKAYYEGDKVTIEITDDGAGMDEEKIVSKAISQGLISADEAETMSSNHRLKLIFKPGFSTAESVSDVSGRGVGMDVVRNSVEKLSGAIDLSTAPGKGSTVKVKLPITLAILRILLFKVAKQVLSIPLYNVQETITIQRDDIYSSNNQRVINLRGSKGDGLILMVGSQIHLVFLLRIYVPFHHHLFGWIKQFHPWSVQ